MLHIAYIWCRILAVCLLSLLVFIGNAAGQKEFGNQNNVYMTEWARLKHQAEVGDPNALFTLGNYYYKPPRGSSFRQNLKKSAEYYFQAGIRENAAAQYNFAFMLHKGLGVSKNLLESYVWFKLASINPSPVAKHINQQSKDVAATLQVDLNQQQLDEADKKIEYYTKIIKEKRYRAAKFPG